MSSEFDPYRKWLGIPPKDQPPHRYRLLGIAAFEDDPDVIQNAADRQMAHVRQYQSGQHSQLSQRILNELSAAKVCLLRPEKKAEYDKQLRAELRSRKASATAPPPPPVDIATPPGTAVPPTGVPTRVTSIAKPPPASSPPPAAPASAAESGPKIRSQPARHRRRRRKTAMLPIALSLLAIGGLIATGVVAMNLLGEKSKGKKSEPRDNDRPYEDDPSPGKDGKL